MQGLNTGNSNDYKQKEVGNAAIRTFLFAEDDGESDNTRAEKSHFDGVISVAQQ